LSKTNADDFAADRLIDGVEIGKCLKRLEEVAKRNDPAPETSVSQSPGSPYDSIVQQYTTELNSEGITRAKPTRMVDIAQSLKMTEEYECVNKLCSKFVHPTAWSLFTAESGAARFPEAGEIFFVCGAQYFASVFAEFLPHIRRWGLHHKPAA
jgi:hypothetical protein